MRTTRRAALALPLAAGAAGRAARAQPAAAAAWPGQTVRVVVAYVAGGTTDIVARMAAEGLAERLAPRGAAVVVENRAGGGGLVGTESVVRAAPDGHTLLLCASAHAVFPELNPNLGWDPVADFTPVGTVAATPYMLIAHPGLPVRTVPELIAHAKANPGRLNYASTGIGTAQHLSGELLRRQAGIDIVHVPYRGSGAVRADLLAGRINFMFENLALTLAMTRSGEVRGLAVTSPERSPGAPDLPTMAEAGLPEMRIEGWFGLLGPRGLPPGVVAALNAALNEWLGQPATAQRLAGLGARALGGPPEALAALVRAEREKWGRVIRDAGIRVE
jgi:tripartite-type tricarboxylate transporter receptor subunit TctC